MSIIFISHSLGLVSELCDDVVVMDAGNVVETAPALFAAPRHPWTRALLDCERSTRDDADPRLTAILGEVPDLVTAPAGCIFVERCGERLPACRAEQPGLRTCRADHRAACIHLTGP